jgi:hypothetical protein
MWSRAGQAEASLHDRCPRSSDELGLRNPRIASRMPLTQPAILVFTATWLLANVVSRILLGVGGGGKFQYEAYPA